MQKAPAPVNMSLLMRPGTISCVLCQGVVSYREGNAERFIDHMNIEHAAAYNLRFILAGCLMNEDERKIVSEIVEEREATDRMVMVPEVKNETNRIDSDEVHEAAINSVSDSTDLPAEVTNVEDIIKSINCHKCNSTFSSGKNLKTHLLRVHKMQVNNGDGNKQDMVDDTKVTEGTIDTPNRKWHCDKCDSILSNAANLKRHVRNLHRAGLPDQPKEKEDVGDQNSSVESRTSQSPIKSESIENTIWSCDLCSYTCTKESSLKNHNTKKHIKSRENENMLDDSQKKFIGDSDSSKKNARGLNQVDFSYHQCEICEYKSNDIKSLKIHKTLKHKVKEDIERKLSMSDKLSNKNANDKLDFQCKKCDFKSASEKEMKQHKFRTHRHEMMKKIASSVTLQSDAIAHGDRLDDQKNFSMTDNQNDNRNVVDDEILLIEDMDITSHNAVPLNGLESDMLTDDEASDTGFKESEYIKVDLTLANRRSKILQESEYFKAFPNNLVCWLNKDKELMEDESLPKGYTKCNGTTKSGRKYTVYITPDRNFKLRSQVAVLEFMKYSGNHSEEEIQIFAARLRAKAM